MKTFKGTWTKLDPKTLELPASGTRGPESWAAAERVFGPAQTRETGEKSVSAELEFGTAFDRECREMRVVRQVSPADPKREQLTEDRKVTLRGMDNRRTWLR